MRKSLVTLLIVGAITLGLPTDGSAQAGKSSSLFGQIVDATGRGSSGRTIELVSNGIVVGMTTSNSDGHFSFALSGAGTYVVRTFVKGHAAGVRVSVVPGENPPMALLVLPSAATTSAQVGVLISNSISVLTSLASVTLSTATAAIVTQIKQREDDEILASPQTAQQTAQVLNTIIQQISPGAPLVTVNPTTGAIVIPPGLTPGLGGLTPDIISAITDVATNVPTGSGH